MSLITLNNSLPSPTIFNNTQATCNALNSLWSFAHRNIFSVFFSNICTDTECSFGDAKKVSLSFISSPQNSCEAQFADSFFSHTGLKATFAPNNHTFTVQNQGIEMQASTDYSSTISFTGKTEEDNAYALSIIKVPVQNDGQNQYKILLNQNGHTVEALCTRKENELTCGNFASSSIPWWLPNYLFSGQLQARLTEEKSLVTNDRIVTLSLSIQKPLNLFSKQITTLESSLGTLTYRISPGGRILSGQGTFRPPFPFATPVFSGTFSCEEQHNCEGQLIIPKNAHIPHIAASFQLTAQKFHSDIAINAAQSSILKPECTKTTKTSVTLDMETTKGPEPTSTKRFEAQSATELHCNQLLQEAKTITRTCEATLSPSEQTVFCKAKTTQTPLK